MMPMIQGRKRTRPNEIFIPSEPVPQRTLIPALGSRASEFSVELRVRDVDFVRSDAHDGAVFLVERDLVEEPFSLVGVDVVVGLVVVGESGEFGTGDVGDAVEEEAVDGEEGQVGCKCCNRECSQMCVVWQLEAERL